jgi:hypothetical protein
VKDDELAKWLRDIQRDLTFLRKAAIFGIGYAIGLAIVEIISKAGV